MDTSYDIVFERNNNPGIYLTKHVTKLYVKDHVTFGETTNLALAHLGTNVPHKIRKEYHPVSVKIVIEVTKT